MFSTINIYDANGTLLETFHDRKDICLRHALSLWESNQADCWTWT